MKKKKPHIIEAQSAMHFALIATHLQPPERQVFLILCAAFANDHGEFDMRKVFTHFRSPPDAVKPYQDARERNLIYQVDGRGHHFKLNFHNTNTQAIEKTKAAYNSADRFIYVISDGEHTKIGQSRNPALRLKGLSTSNGRKLSLIKTYKGRAADIYRWERVAHDALASLHRSGEWFDIEPLRACETIESIISSNAVGRGENGDSDIDAG